MAFHIGAGIVLTQGEKYILVQETQLAKAGLYNLPAGTLEMGEDFLQCIVREAKEETGADVQLSHFLGVYQTVMASGSNVVFLVFAGSVPAGAVFRSDEHEVIRAFGYNQITALAQAGKLRSPIVCKAIEDYRAGKTLPLASVQAWHVASLEAIDVEKAAK